MNSNSFQSKNILVTGADGFIGSHLVELLARMGANITVKDNSATVVGVKDLQGKTVLGSDLRATAALALAGLSANGKTIV